MKDAKGHGSDGRGGAAAHAQGVAQVGKVPMTLPPESPQSRQLRMFADNDGDLHRQSFQPIVSNLDKKMGKGVYDSSKAATLWGYHADRAAQAYTKQFGDSGQKWHQAFSPAVRKEAAAHWEADEAPRIRGGEYK